MVNYGPRQRNDESRFKLAIWAAIGFASLTKLNRPLTEMYYVSNSFGALQPHLKRNKAYTS